MCLWQKTFNIITKLFISKVIFTRSSDSEVHAAADLTILQNKAKCRLCAQNHEKYLPLIKIAQLFYCWSINLAPYREKLKNKTASKLGDHISTT